MAFHKPGWAMRSSGCMTILFRLMGMENFIEQCQGRERICFRVVNGMIERYVHFVYIPQGEVIGYGRASAAEDAMVAVARSLGTVAEVTAIVLASELAKITGTAYFSASPGHLISIADAGELGRWVRECLAPSSDEGKRAAAR